MKKSHEQFHCFQLLSLRICKRDNNLHHVNELLQIPTHNSHYVHPSSLSSLSKNSQRQLRRCLNRELVRYFERFEVVIHVRLLRFHFRKWKITSIRKEKAFNSDSKQFWPLLEYKVPYQLILENGMKSLVVCLYHIYIRCLRTAFSTFKRRCYEKLSTMRKFFHKWDQKACLLKLNRMNGGRYMKLLKSLGQKTIALKLKSGFTRWKQFSEFRENLILIRLIFRCWKLTIAANKHTRQSRLVTGLKVLQRHAKFSASRGEQMIKTVQALISTNLLKSILGRWHLSLRIKIALRKVLSIFNLRVPLWKYWGKWVQSVQWNASSLLAKPSMEPKLPIVVYNTTVTPTKDIHLERPISSVRHSWNKRCTSPFCSRADLYCSSTVSSPSRYSQITPTNAAKAISLQEKARLRVEILKNMNQEYTKRESFRLSGMSTLDHELGRKR